MVRPLPCVMEEGRSMVTFFPCLWEGGRAWLNLFLVKGRDIVHISLLLSLCWGVIEGHA